MLGEGETVFVNRDHHLKRFFVGIALVGALQDVRQVVRRGIEAFANEVAPILARRCRGGLLIIRIGRNDAEKRDGNPGEGIGILLIDDTAGYNQGVYIRGIVDVGRSGLHFTPCGRTDNRQSGEDSNQSFHTHSLYPVRLSYNCKYNEFLHIPHKIANFVRFITNEKFVVSVDKTVAARGLVNGRGPQCVDSGVPENL